MSSPLKVEVLILDFDGVVVESNGVKTEAFGEVFDRFPEHRDEMMAFHDSHAYLPRRAKFEHLVRDLMGRPDDNELIEQLAADFSRRVVDRVVSCEMVPGADELLAEFSPRLPTYLASVTPELELLEILRRRNLSTHFRGVFGCPPTPKADAVRSVLQEHGADPRHVLLVGDSAGDLAAARETGVGFLGRDSGLPFGDREVPTYPDLYAIADVLRSRVDTD